jgi:AcrR family transcriptional regulator
LKPDEGTGVRGAAADDGRRVFLDAAMRCFELLGPERTTMVDIARAAGVTRQTLYNHFPGGKDTLMGELIADEARRVNARALRKVVMSAPAADVLADAAVELVISARASHMADVLVRHGGLTASSRVLDRSGDVRLVMAEYWEPILAELERRGELRPGLDHGETIAWLTFVHVALVARPDAFRGRRDATRAALLAHLVPLLTGTFEH